MIPGAIATQLHVSRKFVWFILSVHRQTQDVTPRKSSGRPRNTTARQDRLFFRMVRRGRRRSAASLRDEWRNDLERPVSRVTVNRRLLERGYRPRRPVKKPKLTACHKGFRLRFARQHRNLTVHHWRHAVFGESLFRLHRVDGQVSVRRLRGEALRNDCVCSIRHVEEALSMLGEHLIMVVLRTWSS